jgi:hypothetical protein
VVGAVIAAAEAPLIHAGFTAGGDGWFKRTGELFQVVRLVAPKKSRLVWTSFGVALEVVWARDHEDRFGIGSLPATPVEPAAQRFAEARLWDLIPGRPRGGAWTVTRDSVLGVVGADVAAALVQYGLPYLDEMTKDVRQLPDVMRRYQASGLYSPLVDWRERKARVLWLMGEREAAQELLGNQ